MTEADDLDAFIQQQKAKIAKERDIIANTEPKPERRKWDKPPPAEIFPLSKQPEPSQETGLASDTYKSSEDKRKSMAEKKRTPNDTHYVQKFASQNRVETPEESGLALDSYRQRSGQTKWLTDKKRDYNNKLNQQFASTKAVPETPEKGLPLGAETDDDKHRKLREDRRKEYNDLISKTDLHARKPPPTPEHVGLPVGQYADERKKLNEQRHQEYNEFMKDRQAPNKRRGSDSQQHTGLPLGEHNTKKLAEEQRQKEYNEFLKTQESVRQRPKSPEHEGLPLAQNNERRRELEETRRNEYNALLAQKGESGGRRDIKTPEHIGLPIGGTAEKRKKLEEERRTEYNSFLARQTSTTRLPASLPPPPAQEDTSVHIVRDTVATKTLDTDKQSAYSDVTHKQQNQGMHRNKENLPPKPDTPEAGLVGQHRLGDYESRRRQLQEERKKEYNALLSQKNSKPTPPWLNEDEPKDRGLSVPKKQQNSTRRGKPDDEAFIGSIPGLQDRPSAQEKNRRNKEQYREFLDQQRDEQQRGKRAGIFKPYAKSEAENFNEDPEFQEFVEKKKEYERYLQQKEQFQQFLRASKSATLPRESQKQHSPSKHDPRLSDEDDAPRGKSRRKDDDFYATLPGLRDHSSAEASKMQERNREYNDFLKSKHATPRARSQVTRHADSEEEDDRPAPRKGWATPTYEEILNKKRKEESSYRRHNDAEYGGLRSSRSESNIHRLGPDPYADDHRRLQNLDREYQSRKTRFSDERSHRLIDDPTWLDIEHSSRKPDLQDAYHQDRLARLKLKYDSQDVDPLIHRLNETHKYKLSQLPTRVQPLHTELPRGGAERPPPSRYDSRPPEKPQGYSRPSVDPYGATLAIGAEQRASADQRKKEAYRRELELQMNEFREHRNRERLDDLKTNSTGARNVASRPERREPPVPRYRNEDFSPREILFDDPRKPRGASILENGFDDLYKPSFLTQPLSHGFAPSYRTPQDDAYMYYANRDPLEPLNLGGYAADPVPFTSERREKPRVTFDDSVNRRPDSHREPPAPARTPFPVDNDRANVQKDAQKSYQEELKRQIEEQKMKKQKDKEERDRYDRKLDAEIRMYDPFGRGGGGAPMKDSDGNVIANWKQAKGGDNKPPSLEADLRQMHADPYKSPRGAEPDRYKLLDTGDKSPRKDGDTFARGGHGIFGEPITDAEKVKRNKYQEDLRIQMEERKRQQDEEKAKLKAEDERLLRKIEEDQKKMQEELENETRKAREKHEAAQKQQEELKRQQDEKRKEQERKRMESDEKHQAELRRQEDERRKDRERPQEPPASHSAPQNRSSSPPIPTLRPKGEETKQEQKRHSSPPVPAMRSKTEPPPSPPVPAQKTHSRPPSRVPSADVLNQLARMRQQLQSERKRVESDLQREQVMPDEPEVFDPRIQNKPSRVPNVDVFEIARKKEAAPVRRQPPSQTNQRNVDEFKNLKNKGGDDKQDFRKLFPQTPNTDDTLETQQRVMLMQQEENLTDLRHRNGPLDKMDPQDLGIFRTGSTTSAALLQSDSAFIDVPEDQQDRLGHNSRAVRNDSARDRRRLRSETPKSIRTDSVGSLVSLDPDMITRKNESRLRKLKSFTGDDNMSVASADADEVLDRFMAKQQHTRPPSEQTLADDSWMRPGTRVT